MQRMESGEPLIGNERRLKGLLVAGLAGDEHAYRHFLQEVSLLLRGFLRRRLGRLPDEVEDLVQECLLALHNQRHTYDTEQPVTAWVHAIAKYKLFDLLRRRSRREALHDPLEDEQQIFACSEEEAADARNDIAVLLEQLPPQQRLPIIHMKLQGLSVTEAARASGMSESAIKVGVHRGLKALAALLRKTHEN